jgi:hypothetical protein
MRFVFELVVERCQRGCLAEAMGECLLEQPVGEPGVTRQEWAVQVRTDCTPDAAALPAAHAVVAEPGHDAAERLGACIEVRPSSVVLESGQCPRNAWVELAFQQDVTDHACVPGDRVERKEADPRQLGTVKVAVRAAEELIPAANREHGSTLCDRLPYPGGLDEQVLCDERLFAILAAADVEQIVLARIDPVSN